MSDLLVTMSIIRSAAVGHKRAIMPSLAKAKISKIKTKRPATKANALDKAYFALVCSFTLAPIRSEAKLEQASKILPDLLKAEYD